MPMWRPIRDLTSMPRMRRRTTLPLLDLRHHNLMSKSLGHSGRGLLGTIRQLVGTRKQDKAPRKEVGDFRRHLRIYREQIVQYMRIQYVRLFVLKLPTAKKPWLVLPL